MKNENRIRIWTFYVLMALGIWLFVTPVTFGIEGGAFSWSNGLSGLGLIVFGDLGRRTGRALWIWVLALIGIWLQFSPLLFWVKEPVGYLNDTLVGCLVLFFSLLLYPLPNLLGDEEPFLPPGWSFNPSAFPTRIWVGFLAFLCWMIARYLASYQLGYIDAIWDPFFHPGTQAVLESSVSKAFPVPDAGLGAMAYTLEMCSVFIGGTCRWRTAPWAVLIFGILVIPVSLISVLLIILQPLVVGTWCTLCLLTAVCMLAGIPFAISEVLATLQFLRHSKEKPRRLLLFEGGGKNLLKTKAKEVDLRSSWSVLWKSACSGVSFPWTLSVSLVLSILVMGAPSFFTMSQRIADCDPILGALGVVSSVVAFSEMARKVRFFYLLLGLYLGMQVFWQDGSWPAVVFHLLVGGLWIVLSFHRGPIYEKSSWSVS